MSFFYCYCRSTKAIRTIHGESGMNVGNYGMSEMISLYCVHIILTFCLVVIE